MKKLLYSVLAAACTLFSVGCGDDEHGLALDLSRKDVWSCDASGASQRVIVTAPQGWTCTDIPEWCIVAPSQAAGSREIKITCAPNTDKTRKAILKIKCDNGEVIEYRVKQQGILPLVDGFPVEWLFTADYYKSGKYTSAFVDDNALPAEVGNGYIGYTRNPEWPTSTELFLITVGTTGHPYVRSFMKGDCWTFTVKVTEEAVPAGATMNVKFITRSSANGPRYMMVDYLDGDVWRPAGDTRSVAVEGEGTVTYSVDLVADLTGNKKVGTDNAQVDLDFVLSEGVQVGQELKVRYYSVSSLSCSNEMQPGNHDGVNRLAGAVGTSPVINVSDLPGGW